MSALQLATSVGAVEEHSGARIKARRTAIGMSVAALAKRAGVDRGSLAALEDGRHVRDTTVAAIDKTLSDLEHEMGMDVPSQVAPVEPNDKPEPLRFTFRDIYGVGELIVEGPVDRPDELIASVAKLLAEIRNEGR